MNDSQLIDKVLAGDNNSFELIIIKYQRKLYATVLNIVKDADFAQDIVQDAFMKAFEKLSSLRNRNQFYPWVKRIAINCALLSFEKNKRMVDVGNNSGDEEKGDDFFDRITDYANPEEDLLNDELKKFVRRFVDSLPDKLRVVIILREVEEMSYEEIAEMLNIPVGTVRSRLFNARQYIKQRLINQGFVDGMSKVS